MSESRTVASSIYALANPLAFQRLADRLVPWFTGLAVISIALGLYWGLVTSPPDYQQGESVRIMYIHVPSAWMCLFCYTVMALASFVGFVFKHPIADVAAKSIAPIGAAFTFLALVTGSLWGKPTWGTYWVWDARLTSVLILFFLYLGYMALWQAMDDKVRAARAAAVLAMVGFINVPIIKFSVDWWNSLHQPASISKFDAPSIHPSMLMPLLAMAIGFMALATVLHLMRMKTEILEQRVRRARLSQTAPVAAMLDAAPSPSVQGGK